METLQKVCSACGTNFNKPPNISLNRWYGRFCCSRKCNNKNKRKENIDAKVCRYCSVSFIKKPETSYRHWHKQTCCSKECGDKSKKTPWLIDHQLKVGSNLGLKTQFKKGDKRVSGLNNSNWKGEQAGYFAKHEWIRNNFGKPKFCEFCKNSTKRMYHWANISGEFKRERDDWYRLCVSCHKRFDLDRIVSKNIT